MNLKRMLPAILIFLLACSHTAKINVQEYNTVLNKAPANWELDECNKIIDLFTFTNFSGLIDQPFISYSGMKNIKITAILLNYISLSAITRKQAILQRLPIDDFRYFLKDNLEAFTRYTLDEEGRIIKNESIPVDSSTGISFNLFFENQTDPYAPVELMNGYSYFFLENPVGRFSRVKEISGSFADEDFVLTDYLRVTVTFYEEDDSGKKLFDDVDFPKELKLVFNGLTDEPIELYWKYKLNR